MNCFATWANVSEKLCEREHDGSIPKNSHCAEIEFISSMNCFERRANVSEKLCEREQVLHLQKVLTARE